MEVNSIFIRVYYVHLLILKNIKKWRRERGERGSDEDSKNDVLVIKLVKIGSCTEENSKEIDGKLKGALNIIEVELEEIKKLRH